LASSGFLFQTVQFWQFQTQKEEGAKIEDLKIQGEFKHEKEGKALKDQDKRNSSQKDEVAKAGWSGFGFRRVWFFQNS
jgi:hypothetical protein